MRLNLSRMGKIEVVVLSIVSKTKNSWASFVLVQLASVD